MFSPFVRDGHEVHVVLPEPGPLVALLEGQGIIVHIFRSLAVVDRQDIKTLSGKLAFCGRLACSVVWISALARKIKADVVHTNTAVLPAPALAAFLTRRPHIWHIREMFSEFEGVWRFFQRYIWVLSTEIITISSAVKEQFDLKYRGKCTTAFNCLGPDATIVDRNKAALFRSALGDPKLLVGVVGRIKWLRKGQEVLVKAAAMLVSKYPEARYVIVGSVSPGYEDHLERLKQLIHDQNLDERISFVGDVAHPRDVFAAFDVTVVPSVTPEPFGRVVMESLAAGTPVIGSHCGGIPEQIVEGVTGLLFTPGDEEALARALDQLLSNRSQRIKMGLEGVQYVRERFQDKHVYVQFAKIFRSALGLES